MLWQTKKIQYEYHVNKQAPIFQYSTTEKITDPENSDPLSNVTFLVTPLEGRYKQGRL